MNALRDRKLKYSAHPQSTSYAHNNNGNIGKMRV